MKVDSLLEIASGTFCFGSFSSFLVTRCPLSHNYYSLSGFHVYHFLIHVHENTTNPNEEAAILSAMTLAYQDLVVAVQVIIDGKGGKVTLETCRLLKQGNPVCEPAYISEFWGKVMVKYQFQNTSQCRTQYILPDSS